MEVVRITQSRAAELDFVRAFSPPWEADGEVGIGGGGCGWEGSRRRGRASEGKDRCAAGEEDGRLLPVCVTSAASYLGQAIVDCLLNRGYCVRLAFDSQEDLEKLGETEALEGRGEGRISAVTVDLTDVDGLCEILDGCAGVFHTSAFVDPAGFSGYSKHMAEMEAAVATTVVEASARTPSVRRCVLTSSLLACVWRQRQHQHQHQHEHDGHQHHGDCPGPATLDESCWSDETLCREKKLWLALGKTMAERAAWRAASGGDVKLATLCPGLLTGPGSFSRNTSPSVAYLKGGGEMYAAGLLATAEVGGVAEAHVCAYEALGRGGAACGRYICFDRVVRREEAAAELGRQLGLAKPLSDGAGGGGGGGGAARFELSNGKLRRLMTRRRCSYVAHTDSSQE